MPNGQPRTYESPGTPEVEMPQIALHAVLEQGREPDYELLHETIPAGVAAALVAGGVRDWRIWRNGRHLFHLVDVDDYDSMVDTLRGNPADIAWKAEVVPLHSDVGGMPLPLLWSLGDQLGRDAH